MSGFDYKELLEQIRNQTDTASRHELLQYIGDNGDDRFIEPLIKLLETDDSPNMRYSLYDSFNRIGSKLAEEVIQKQIRRDLPTDDGHKITQEDWDKAVDYITSSLKPNFVEKVKKTIEKEGKLWALDYKGSFGVYVRNLLRGAGFNWGEEALQKYWSWILEDAIAKYQKNES
ncbi:MAG: hypothetical protein U9O98_00450 [Asgard group archaeon]|nr:hypothetical protein [Asgard group archaeon]